MIHSVVDNLKFVQNEVFSKSTKCEIIVVSKTHQIEQIKPLLEIGHEHFGENKVQEAIDKWTSIKQNHKNLQLHMIGKLQTNKVKYVIPLFDYIHSLDNLKLAEKISSEQKKINKQLKIFIQVNIGNEAQKNGIKIEDLKNFYSKCLNDLGLNIVGLMCIPPISNNAELYFSKMLELKKLTNSRELSMGMSADYMEAIKYGSSFVRIGSKIFGSRI